MIAADLPRRIATALLQLAISIAPQEALDWGHAMLSELRHVEGNWAALFWSLGGAGVLAKHALVALIFPSRNRPAIPSGGDFFSKEGSMRKPALALIASCVVASLLFFLVPVFRQAFRVSLLQWHYVLHASVRVGDLTSGAELDALARKAEENRDAEGLAFVATRHPYGAKSVQLAEEAVRLDPRLTWIYAPVAEYATPYYSFPQIDRWGVALGKYDPQNALPHLMAAEKIDLDQVDHRRVPEDGEHEPAAWKDAMAEAFQCAKLDDYSVQRTELDRRVMARYHITDPFQAEDDGLIWLPSFGVSDSYSYSALVLKSAEDLESRGDHKGAFEMYSAIAKFGQLLSETRFYLRFKNFDEALTRLEALSRKDGNEAQAELYASLLKRNQTQFQEKLAYLRARGGGDSVPRWNAFVARASGAAMLASVLLLVTCLIAVLIRGRSLRLSALRPSGLTLVLACTSAIVVLLSSAMLYVSYRPYAEIFRSFVSSGDVSGLRQLSDFLEYTLVPLGTGNNPYLDFQEHVFHFWVALVLLCGLAVLFAVVRHFQTRPRQTAV